MPVLFILNGLLLYTLEFGSITVKVWIYRKLGNFHVEIIHVVNIHVDLFSWVYGTHENILT